LGGPPDEELPTVAGAMSRMGRKKQRKATITLQCLLRFETREDREAVLYLMRRFSSATRFAHQRLLEGMEDREVR
jgi:hypothetical protein